MTGYIEREAFLDAIERGKKHQQDADDIAEMLQNFPAADVRPVVLCKDCRHRDPEDHKCDCGGTERQGCPFKVADDYFCAYGER